MSFFGRVFNYVFNQLLVDTLANNRSFQQFAIKSDAMLKEAAKNGAKQTDHATAKMTEFSKIFQDEVKKGFEEVAKKK